MAKVKIEYDSLSLTDFIKLQDEINRELQARFERRLAMVFTDVVDSTVYFERFGNAAGRGLLQRHLDHLASVLSAHGGRIVDTAGDGAFSVFPEVVSAAAAMIELQLVIAKDNAQLALEHHLSVRTGLHWGAVLTDGEIVTGDAVHLAARIANSAAGAEIRLSQEAVGGLTPALKLRCNTLSAQTYKGFPDAVEIAQMEWRDPEAFPTHVRIEETGVVHPLPSKDVIRFGRLDLHGGRPANDIVLSHTDPISTQRISRWHFELHRQVDGYHLQTVSKAPTEVNGRPVRMGEPLLVRPGTSIKLSRVLTLTLVAERSDESMSETVLGSATVEME